MALFEFTPHMAGCEKHGEYQQNFMQDDVERWHGDCPQCVQEKRISKIYERAAIPKRFKMKTFENFRTDAPADKRNHAECFEYARGFREYSELGRCLILVGVPGTGKTHLACAVANVVMNQGYTALFTTVSEMIKRIRSTWSKDSGETEEKVINGLVSVDLLIIDEVGIQYGTEAEKIQLFEVINRRYEDVKPTIIISNLPPESADGKDLKTYLGERSFDRLRENGGKALIFSGSSKRSG